MRKILLLLISSLVLLAGCEDRVVRHSSGWYKKNKNELISQVELCAKEKESTKTAESREQDGNTLKEKRAKIDKLKDTREQASLNCLRAEAAYLELQIVALKANFMGLKAHKKVGYNLLNNAPADEGYEPLTHEELKLESTEEIPQLTIDKDSGVITVYLNQGLEGGRLINKPTIVRAQTAEKKGEVTFVCTFEGEAIDLLFITEDCLP